MNSDLARIAFLSLDVNPHTGWGRYTKEFCTALYRKGIPFELHLPVNLKNSCRDIEHDLKIHYSLPPFSLSFRWKPWHLISFIKHCGRINFGDVRYIHSLIEFPYSFVALRHADFLEIPFGLTLHGTYGVIPQKTFPDKIFFKKTLSQATVRIAVSCYTAKRVEETFGRKLEIEVIPPGVNIENLASNSPSLPASAESLPNAAKIPSHARIILSVGALKPRKGMDVLIKAMPKVIKVFPNAHVFIVGPGNPIPYQLVAKRERVENHVHFTGVLDGDLLRFLYHRCDLFALLSREDKKGRFEGFGMVYIEASACGKPVVGTLSGGIREAVINGETGILVPPDDPDAAADAIISILADQNLARKYGDNGRLWASRFTWDNAVDKFLELITQKTGLSF